MDYISDPKRDTIILVLVLIAIAIALLFEGA